MRSSRPTVRIAALAVALVALSGAPAKAQEIEWVSPVEHAADGQPFKFTIAVTDGAMIDYLAEISFDPAQITHGDVTMEEPNVISAIVTIPAGAASGWQDVIVSSLEYYYRGEYMFHITEGGPAASLASISPSTGYRGSEITVTVRGSDTSFDASSSLSFSPFGIQVLDETATSATSLEASLSISSSAPLGAYDATVTTGSEVASGQGLFTVEERSFDLSPDSGIQGQTLPTMTLTGGPGGYTSASAVSLGDGVSLGSFQATDDLTLVLSDVAIAADALVGRRDLLLSMPGDDLTFADAFAVLQGAETALVSIDPDHADAGHPGIAVELVGLNTHFDRGQAGLSFSGIGLSTLNTTAVDSTHLQTTVVILPAAAQDSRDVTVTVSGAFCDLLVPAPCERATFEAGFSVTAPGSITSVDPALLEPPGQATITVEAVDGQFSQGLTELYIEPPDGIEVSGVNVLAADRLEATVQVGEDASGNPRDLLAVTGTEVARGEALLDIFHPEIRAVTPDRAPQGTADQTVYVLGTDIPFDAETQVSFSGQGIDVGQVRFEPDEPDQVSAVISIAETAPVGLRDVSVQVGSLVLTLEGAFAVTEARGDEPGCTCAASGRSTQWLGLALVAGMLLLRRRRR
ncbi:MAG: hypothetical protein JXR96_23285 [Deltaproteobacteria bacterium]|nr:hypothetical protein [Deltaproteobacteria bacterium]